MPGFISEPEPSALTIESHFLGPEELEGAEWVLRHDHDSLLALSPVVHDLKGTHDQIAMVFAIARGVLWRDAEMQSPETILTLRVERLPTIEGHMARLALGATQHMLQDATVGGEIERVAASLREAHHALVELGNIAMNGSGHAARFEYRAQSG
jgi:hypothetical protein